MRSGTRFHASYAALYIGQAKHQLCTCQLNLQNNRTMTVFTDQVEYVLATIDANRLEPANLLFWDDIAKLLSHLPNVHEPGSPRLGH